MSATEEVSAPAAATVYTTPLPHPLESCTPPERETLTEEQQAKYDWLLERARNWTEVPSTKVAASALTEGERMWLTRECLLRYLRATKWHEKDSEKRLLGTLAWRRDFGVLDLTPEHISPENETGKQMLAGYDKTGRPCHYLIPGRQNTNPSHRQVEHLVYMVERILDVMPPRQESLSLMIDFKPNKQRTNTAPGIGIAREVLNILQTHYPERLGRALIINVPFIVRGFFRLITPFIDPRTVEKLKFNEDMTQYVPKEQLWTGFEGGEMEFEYDHAKYWPALTELCASRREERTARWVAGGKHIGEFEDYLTGYLEKGVGGEAEPDTSAKKEEEENGELPADAEKAAAAEKKADDIAADVAKLSVGTSPSEKRPEVIQVIETTDVEVKA